MTEQETYILLASLTSQIMEQPREARLHLDRAKVYLSLHDTAKALDDLDTALQLDPQLAEAYLLRGQLRFMLHNKNAAFEDLQKAATLNPLLLNQITGEYKTKEPPKAFKI